MFNKYGSEAYTKVWSVIKWLDFNKSLTFGLRALQIINNYLTRLSKISWFVSGEQINYLPMPKAEANFWSARHWQITIFCEIEFNNCFIIQQEAFVYSSPFFFLASSSNFLYSTSASLTFDVRGSFSSTFLSSKYCRNTFTATLVAFLVLSLVFVQLDN